MNISLKKCVPLLFFAALTATSCKDNKDKDTIQEEASQKAEATAAPEVKQITLSKDQYKLSEIEIGSIELRNLSNVIKLNGSIDAEPGNVASVSAPLGGYIKTAGLLPGQQVKKGQLLATLENPQFISMQQEYLESISRLEYLEQEFKRQQILRNEDINSAKTFQQVSSDYKVMKAKISGLEQQMALVGISSSSVRNNNRITRTANLYSPISGYIKTSNVNIGKYVASTDVLFEITGTNNLHLALSAFEKDLGKIKVGQTVKFSLSNENNYERTAKVFLVGQTTDDTKTIPVNCNFAQKPGLKPGMYVKAWIETGTEQKNAVPNDAIVQMEGIDYIIEMFGENKDGYKFRLLQVAKGIEQEGYTAIDLPENINAQELKIVTKNAYTILSAIKNAEEEE